MDGASDSAPADAVGDATSDATVDSSSDTPTPNDAPSPMDSPAPADVPGVDAGPGPDGGGMVLPCVRNSYDPPWAGVTPAMTIAFNRNAAMTDEQNGAALADAIGRLTAGQMIQIGAGTYSVNRYWNVTVRGTAAAPIWIVAAPGAMPVITRPDDRQNVMNVGSGMHVEYVAIRGLEFRGGSDLLRLYDVSNVWVDRNFLHDGNGVGVSANAHDTSYVWITRNEIRNPGGAGATAEGMYLGANNSAVRMSCSVIAQNRVHDTAGTQGDGIELKQGSFNNWIVENEVWNTNYPCILVYGTDAMGINLVERNTLRNSRDNTLQVQGEAIVRNNLVIDGAGVTFSSTDHQGMSVNLRVVHNTFLNRGRAVNLSSWNGRAGMVFANNVVYSATAESIRFPSGSAGVMVAGNVVVGSVSGVTTGFTMGRGLIDFVSATYDGMSRNALPSPGSPIIGRGDAMFGVPEDITGMARMPPLDPGAYDVR